jgi:hypothetical protein
MSRMYSVVAGEGAVRDFDAGNGGAHGSSLVMNAVAALRVSVCSPPWSEQSIHGCDPGQ